MNFREIASATMFVVAAGFFVGPANASLVLLSAENFTATGLGAVNSILTVGSPSNSTSETGSVGRLVGNPNDDIIGDAKTGASQTQTRTLSQLGVTSAYSLRVVFNALEPGGTLNSILLSNLTLSIFSPTGALLFNSGSFTPVSFPDTLTGAGNSGFVFGLDAAQAAAAQTLAFGAGFGSNLVGLAATANNATGGFETFFVANTLGGGGTAIPEPGTIVLFGAGLLALVARRRSS